MEWPLGLILRTSSLLTSPGAYHFMLIMFTYLCPAHTATSVFRLAYPGTHFRSLFVRQIDISIKVCQMDFLMLSLKPARPAVQQRQLHLTAPGRTLGTCSITHLCPQYTTKCCGPYHPAKEVHFSHLSSYSSEPYHHQHSPSYCQ